jgi:hypothetical protein
MESEEGPGKLPLLQPNISDDSCICRKVRREEAGPKARQDISEIVHRALRDEVFCLNRDRDCLNRDRNCLNRCWELFLIIATVVPAASETAQRDVKIHLAQQTRLKDDALADIAQFTYIRFCARCAIGEPLKPLSSAIVSQIPKQLSNAAVLYGSSIYEQLWAQRLAHPRLPIPFLLHLLVEISLEKGAERTEGVFRRSGNVKHVHDMIAAVNKGGDPAAIFGRAEIHDITALIKQWFVALPEHVVWGKLTGELATVYETDKDYVKFLDRLPPAHVTTLKFLCGFLKRMAGAEAVTKMDLKNYAIVFAPAIVVQAPSSDQFAVVRHTVVSQEFMLAMLQKCETDGFYPIPGSFFGP